MRLQHDKGMQLVNSEEQLSLIFLLWSCFLTLVHPLLGATLAPQILQYLGTCCALEVLCVWIFITQTHGCWEGGRVIIHLLPEPLHGPLPASLCPSKVVSSNWTPGWQCNHKFDALVCSSAVTVLVNANHVCGVCWTMLQHIPQCYLYISSNEMRKESFHSFIWQ